MIEKQIERLSAEEQRLLEIASVAGVEFSACATTKIKHKKCIFRVKNVRSMALPTKNFNAKHFHTKY